LTGLNKASLDALFQDLRYAIRSGDRSEILDDEVDRLEGVTLSGKQARNRAALQREPATSAKPIGGPLAAFEMLLNVTP
jgi:hypothetical protein